MLHPLRQRIAGLLCGGEDLGVAEIATGWTSPTAGSPTTYACCSGARVLKAVPRCRPTPAHYRFSPQAQWAREMLVEEDE